MDSRNSGRLSRRAPGCHEREAELTTQKLTEDLNRELAEFTSNLQISQRVLVVDDEPTIRIVISEYLAGKNILADVVSTGEEGLELLDKNEYAVLVADKNLPGISGMKLLAEAKQRNPDMEVLIITGYASVESALEAIAAGAYDYIPKPMPSLTYLHDKIRGALARHDFEVRIYGVIAYLIKTCKSLLATLEGEDQAEWIRKLEAVLASDADDCGKVRILVHGSKTLARSVENLGHQVSTTMDLDEAFEVAGQQDIRVLILSEESQSLDIAATVTRFQSSYRDLAVFVIAREGSLEKVVQAIAAGVGDYMVRPLEGRDLFGPRLERLVKRQQRIVRYRRVVGALKGMNIELKMQYE